jgi:hypothetical protein
LSNITHATVSREGDIVVLGWMTAYNSQSGGFTHYRRRGLGIQTRDSKDWHMIELPEVEEAQNVVEPEVTGISASSENDVWIVGYYPANYGDDYFPSPLRYARQFVLHWDGQTWHEMPAPNPTDKHLLHDVAMAARGNVWAVERQGWGLGEREHIPGMAAFYVECATSATPVLGVSK